MFDATAAINEYFATAGLFAGNYDTAAATETLRDAFDGWAASEVTTDDVADVVENYRS
jgi:hypothetical protein